jgi:hypothetical protein
MPSLASFFVVVLLVMGFELRALCLWEKHSATWAMSTDLFALVFFQIGPHFYIQASLDLDLSHIARMKGTYHHTQLFIGW